jgi:hypothetical protein
LLDPDSGGNVSDHGQLDLRYPIGGLFVVLGLLLAAFGVTTMGEAPNLNLWWGLAMLAFGGVMLGMARR